MHCSIKIVSIFLSTIVLFFGLNSLTLAEARSGQAVYDLACKVCHQHGIAGAPAKGDQQWLLRVDNKGMAALVNSVEKGLNAMPAGGGCSDCSREEIIKAIQYMLPKNMPM